MYSLLIYISGSAVSWKLFVERSREKSSAELASALDWANSQFKASLKSGSTKEGLACQPIARLLLFQSLSISDDHRQKKKTEKKATSNINTANWNELTRQINDFVARDAPEHLTSTLCRTYTDDKIAQLATLAATTRGSADTNFYSTILLFLMYRAEAGMFKNPFMRSITSSEDQKFPHRAGILLADRLSEGNTAQPREDTRQIRPLFTVRADQQQKFEEYFLRNSMPPQKENERRQVQFVVYRPMRTNPCELMKTYVSVYEQHRSDSEGSGFSYTHIYDPPGALQQKRFSGGRVIPLDDGIYLLGGQRPLENRTNPQPLPFSSLKVIGIRWHDIEKFHSVFPAVIMTTNYTGKLMVSRAAVRLTPIRRSDEGLTLKSVSLSDLPKSLEADAKLESDYISSLENLSEAEATAMREAFPLQRTNYDSFEMAQQIATRCNNDPHTDSGWDVPEGFVRKDNRRRRAFNKQGLNHIISDAVDDCDVKDSDETGFNLWLHTRFGPLALD